MTRIILIIFFFLALVFSARLAHAQSTESFIRENNQLLHQCEENIEKIEKAYLGGEVESSFRATTLDHLKSIHTKAMTRQIILYKARNTQKTVEAQLYKAQELKTDTERIAAEWNTYQNDVTYCQAISKICLMIPAFTDNKKVYYGEDKFFIPPKYYPQARKVYKPMMDSIFLISELYPNTNFTVYIRTTGYADEAQTPIGSVHYNDMAQRMGFDSITDQEINNYMASLRAYDVANTLKKFIQERVNTQSNNLTFRVEPEGRGTLLPDYNENYLPIDDKRRMVEIYWHILPKF